MSMMALVSLYGFGGLNGFTGSDVLRGSGSSGVLNVSCRLHGLGVW